MGDSAAERRRLGRAAFECLPFYPLPIKFPFSFTALFPTPEDEAETFSVVFCLFFFFFCIAVFKLQHVRLWELQPLGFP